MGYTSKKELSTLSKALSRVAADIWEHGDHQELWKVFGRQTVDPPTPKELVFRLAEYVWRESGTPEQQIAYRRWQSAAGAGYGIIAKIQEPEYHVVTSPITKDLDTVERLVQRLNQEQTPVMVRFSLMNLSFDGKVLNIPLFLADRTVDLVRLVLNRNP